MTCPICDHSTASEFTTPSLRVWLCPSCGHRVAAHAGPAREGDYHLQYSQDLFLRALEDTRVRQARRLAALLADCGAPQGYVLDFGSGRGWTLQELKARGYWPLAGTDTSRISVELLAKAGIPAVLGSFQDGRPQLDLSKLSFSPRVVSFLDVVEHFPPDAYIDTLQATLALFPALEWLVIKVPVSNGVLYRTASLFRLAGWQRSIEQLYQVGTFPPHLHYFSASSLERLIDRLGFQRVAETGDRDFDDLLARVGLRLPAWVHRAAGTVFSAIATNGRCDSRLVIARRNAESV